MGYGLLSIWHRSSQAIAWAVRRLGDKPLSKVTLSELIQGVRKDAALLKVRVELEHKPEGHEPFTRFILLTSRLSAFNWLKLQALSFLTFPFPRT